MNASVHLPRAPFPDVSEQDLEVHINLANLQAGSFNIIVAFAGIIGYLWLIGNVLIYGVGGEVYGVTEIFTWLGSILLTGSAAIGQLLRQRHLHVATHALVVGILAAVTCVELALPPQMSAILFILPVIFAGVLLNRVGFFVVSIVTSMLALALTTLRVPTTSILIQVPLTALTMILAVLASWLSTHNLYTALTWSWNSYQRARQNETLARERQGKLAQTLKSLDEAMYRLERANHMLSLARDQAEEARRLKQQFAQTISHELRTPLNLIVGFTEMMTHSPEHYGGQLLPAYVRDLRIVYRNAAHLQTLVNDVLDLARIEAAQMGLMPEKTQPADLVRDVVTTARSLVEAQGLALRTEIAPDLPAMWLDPTRIRQVLFNLLNNASRFTKAGSITVQVRQVEDEVHFAVADTGVGIAPSDLKRIFEEFQQVDGSTRRRYGGTGLGLAISKRFVTLHGGRMWVESELGAGSTFYFSLPVCQQSIDLATSASAFATDQVSHPAAKREENILLVVTPSLPVANLLARRLEGCRTVTAPSLKQARALAQRLYPKAVVIDQACQLENDATSILADFARACQTAHTTFVTCPLSHDPARQHLAVEAYLTKPISRQNLWDVLRQLDEGVNKLLIIEDDNDFVQLLDRMLATSVRPYQVINAYNAQEGLTLMRHHQPDAILLDLQLPDKNGREVIEEIRATPEGEQLPVIVVSGQDEMTTDDALHGAVTMTKAEGWTFSEIVQWLQSWITTTASPTPNATPAP